MAILAATKISNPYILKVDNQDQRGLNMGVEVHEITFDGAADTVAFRTNFSQVLGMVCNYIIIPDDTTPLDIALTIGTNFLVYQAGVTNAYETPTVLTEKTFYANIRKNTAGTVAVIATTVKVRVLVFGLSY